MEPATLARSLLDGERFPTARFVSTKVEPIDAVRAHVIGTLTLRGVSQEITLDVTLNTIKRYPLPRSDAPPVFPAAPR